MKDRYDKHKSRANRARIRELFWRQWDPIGIADDGPPDDEYDSYVAEAYVMLIDRAATVDDIDRYLLDIATHHMGLSESDDLSVRCRRTAEALLDMLPSLVA